MFNKNAKYFRRYANDFIHIKTFSNILALVCIEEINKKKLQVHVFLIWII